TAASGLGRRTDAVDALRMICEVAMGEVEPCDVEARADEAFQRVRCFGGWPDRGHDFGLVVGEWHHSSTMPSRSLRASYFRFAHPSVTDLTYYRIAERPCGQTPPVNAVDLWCLL